MKVSRIDVVIDVSVCIRNRWVLRTEPPFSIDNKFISCYRVLTGEALSAIAILKSQYNCDGKLVSLFLERYCLLPFEE